jgi:hypothetical protein
MYSKCQTVHWFSDVFCCHFCYRHQAEKIKIQEADFQAVLKIFKIFSRIILTRIKSGNTGPRGFAADRRTARTKTTILQYAKFAHKV